MSKPASWTAKENGLPDWAVTALENLEAELAALRPAADLLERVAARDLSDDFLRAAAEASCESARLTLDARAILAARSKAEEGT